jgi:hypothetical protein
MTLKNDKDGNWRSNWLAPDKRCRRKPEKCLHFSGKSTNARRMVARGVSCRWEKRNTRARTWSGCVVAFRLTLRRAHTRRPYAARRAICGSAMPMLRMSGGIHACSRQVKRLVRRRSHRFPSRAVPLVAAMPLIFASLSALIALTPAPYSDLFSF